MHIQDRRLINNRTVRTCLCKECWGGLTVKCVNDQEVVVCVANATHNGFTLRAGVAALKRQQAVLAAEVKRNYLKFYPSPTETPQESIDILFP